MRAFSNMYQPAYHLIADAIVQMVDVRSNKQKFERPMTARRRIFRYLVLLFDLTTSDLNNHLECTLEHLKRACGTPVFMNRIHAHIWPRALASKAARSHNESAIHATLTEMVEYDKYDHLHSNIHVVLNHINRCLL